MVILVAGMFRECVELIAFPRVSALGMDSTVALLLLTGELKNLIISDQFATSFYLFQSKVIWSNKFNDSRFFKILFYTFWEVKEVLESFEHRPNAVWD